MKKVVRAFEVLGVIICYLSVVALIVMVCITVADIFLKQVFKAPITGAVEITRMMTVCMTPAFVSALFKKRHVAVGMFIDKLGKAGQLVFDTFGYLLSAALCSLMFYQGLIEMNKKMMQKQVYTMLRIPTWPFYLVFAIGLGVFALSILVCLVDKYVDAFKSLPPDETGKAAADGGADL